MPIYEYECAAGHRTERYSTMTDMQQIVSCPCGLDAHKIISKVYISVFNPYVDNNFTGKPILVESKQQRDALCAKYHVTYDEVKFNRKPKTTPAVETIDFGDVKRALNERKLPDGTPLDLSVVRPEDPIE